MFELYYIRKYFKRADLAITDLTITSERESGVDFTMPFMNLGIISKFKLMAIKVIFFF